MSSTNVLIPRIQPRTIEEKYSVTFILDDGKCKLNCKVEGARLLLNNAELNFFPDWACSGPLGN